MELVPVVEDQGDNQHEIEDVPLEGFPESSLPEMATTGPYRLLMHLRLLTSSQQLQGIGSGSYLLIRASVLGQVQQTRLIALGLSDVAVIGEEFAFDATFGPEWDKHTIAAFLQYETVHIQLLQVFPSDPSTNSAEVNTCVGEFCCPAWDFLLERSSHHGYTEWKQGHNEMLLLGHAANPNSPESAAAALNVIISVELTPQVNPTTSPVQSNKPVLPESGSGAISAPTTSSLTIPTSNFLPNSLDDEILLLPLSQPNENRPGLSHNAHETQGPLAPHFEASQQDLWLTDTMYSTSSGSSLNELALPIRESSIIRPAPDWDSAGHLFAFDSGIVPESVSPSKDTFFDQFGQPESVVKVLDKATQTDSRVSTGVQTSQQSQISPHNRHVVIVEPMHKPEESSSSGHLGDGAHRASENLLHLERKIRDFLRERQLRELMLRKRENRVLAQFPVSVPVYFASAPPPQPAPAPASSTHAKPALNIKPLEFEMAPDNPWAHEQEEKLSRQRKRQECENHIQKTRNACCEALLANIAWRKNRPIRTSPPICPKCSTTHQYCAFADRGVSSKPQSYYKHRQKASCGFVFDNYCQFLHNEHDRQLLKWTRKCG